MESLYVRILENGREVQLIKPFVVYFKKRKPITVPNGFVTDFASIPQPFWSIVSPWGKYAPATVLHDYLYFNGFMSREESDKIFLTVMKRLKVSRWKRNIMYTAVRVFGNIVWKKYRQRS